MLNLTPHKVVIATQEGELELPSNGVARVSTSQSLASWTNINGTSVPVYVTTYGAVEGVPPAGGETFVVSAMVLARLGAEYKGQAFAPDTGHTALRNAEGQIVAVTQLVGIE